MHKAILPIMLLILVNGCATQPPAPTASMPLTSQLVLMAANNGVETNATAESTKVPIPVNVPCRDVTNNKPDFNEILSRVFAEAVKQNTGHSPNEMGASNSSNLDTNVIEGLTDEAIRQQTGLSREEIKQAAKLLSSGQFRTDLRDIVILVISIIPDMAKALPQSAARLADDIKDLKTKNHVESFQRCLMSIQAKKTCSELQDFYSDPSLKLSRGTLVGLLSNDSFRLALVVYAHSNGVDIDYKDLDFVREQLNSPTLDVNALVKAGQQRLEAKYKIDEAKAKIEALKVSCKGQ